MPKRKKSELERQLEESIRLAKAGHFRKHKRDSLGAHLRSQDGLDMPDSLADPDEFPLHPPEDDEDY